jgi:hypothetical protein
MPSAISWAEFFFFFFLRFSRQEGLHSPPERAESPCGSSQRHAEPSVRPRWGPAAPTRPTKPWGEKTETPLRETVHRRREDDVSAVSSGGPRAEAFPSSIGRHRQEVVVPQKSLNVCAYTRNFVYMRVCGGGPEGLIHDIE